MDQIIQQPNELDLGEPFSGSLPEAISNENLQNNNYQQVILGPNDVKIKKKKDFGEAINTLLIFVCILLPFVGWGIGSLINPRGIDSNDPIMVFLYIVFFPIAFLSQPILLITLAVGLAVIIIFFHKQLGKMIISILLLLAVLIAASTCYITATAPTQEEG